MISNMLWTGCGLALSLLSGINAQLSDGFLTRSTRSFSITTRDLLASETRTIPVVAPTTTGEPCGRVAAAAKSATSFYRVAVSAELAYDCLTSVPVRPLAALGTIKAIEKMVQFQSTLAFLKDPPEGYDNPPVDILGGLADIRNKVSEDQYANEYDLEAEIASFLDRAKDGHLGFDGPTYVGAVRWRRGFILLSLSVDGGPGKIYDLGMAISHLLHDRLPAARLDDSRLRMFPQF
jgi:hypothetical protein